MATIRTKKHNRTPKENVLMRRQPKRLLGCAEKCEGNMLSNQRNTFKVVTTGAVVLFAGLLAWGFLYLPEDNSVESNSLEESHSKNSDHHRELAQLLKNAGSAVDPFGGKQPSEDQLPERPGQPEIHEMDEWSSSRDYTPEHRSVYEGYDDETIFQLAREGDRHALEEGFWRKARQGDVGDGIQMLHKAAELGSTSALITTGHWMKTRLDSVQQGSASVDQVFENLQLSGFEGTEQEQEAMLSKLSAAYYVAALMRGNVHMSVPYLEVLQETGRNGPITQSERAEIYAIATGLYDRMERSRIEDGMAPSDNQYPASYADFYGLPEDASDLQLLIRDAAKGHSRNQAMVKRTHRP